MNYATVNFLDDVLFGVAHLLGIDPTQDLLKDHARPWVMSINTRLRYAWEFWEWPEFTVTEERAFRQVWYSNVDYAAGEGEQSEVYYIPGDKYYRAITNPPVGTLPTNATYFEEIEANELDKYIAYEQYGKQAIGQIYGVYGSSPREATPALEWSSSPSGMGLDVSLWSGTTVWITYKPRPPQFSSYAFQSAAVYRRGNVVIDLDSGDCFMALIGGNNQGVEDGSYWLKQHFPYILSEYVKYAAASDNEDDVQTKAFLLNEAETFLHREVDRLIEQGQKLSYGPKPIYRVPLGTSAYFQNVYWRVA